MKQIKVQSGTKMIFFDTTKCGVFFDVDSHPGVANSCQMARDNNLRTAVSSPSFELWLLLHLIEHAPGPQERATTRRNVQEHWADYDKAVTYSRCGGGYANAVQLAAQLHKIAQNEDSPRRNPSTGVYRLTECIRASGMEADYERWLAEFESEHPDYW